ncbi:Lactate utilization protein C [Planctomycetes bacterium Poly30]|uniref:Lactate utilization protein C n=1 Tax=Saltatorellus ferox TaxID=2528018 RepID=A0A518EKP6_9BACT|nr:Lactate utilization protein C [Planctomycetes bacterium Poly30]
MVDPKSDRELVLERVRSSLAGREAKREDLPLPPVLRAAGLDAFDADVFAERIAMTGAKVIAVSSAGGVPAAVHSIVSDLGVKTLAVSDLALARDAAAGFEGEVLDDTSAREDLFHCDAGISGVYAAVAETGTLVMSTADERNRLTSLVPDVHLAIVRRDQVVPTLDHVFERFGEGAATPPRCITFITGPSRTADIELELVVGVHGPKALYVILVG